MLQNHPSGSVTQSVIFADVSQNCLGRVPIHYIVIRYPQQMNKWLFVTRRIHFTTGHQCFPGCFCHPTVRNFDFSPNNSVVCETLKRCGASCVCQNANNHLTISKEMWHLTDMHVGPQGIFLQLSLCHRNVYSMNKRTSCT